MRLTLRTLMAWMDDTLPPKDVRRIGRQLERSKFSRQLSDRIRRVVRQRRLTVPGMGVNQPVDANVVAAWLDNALPAEATSGFESLCLNSDVHLAEVAACHQILSVLDQPRPIPPATYAAMYRIVKAPEARIQADRLPPQSVVSGSASAAAKNSVFEDETPWPPSPFGRNLPRFVAASAAVSLLLAFGGISLERIVGTRPASAPTAAPAQISAVEEPPGEVEILANAENLPKPDGLPADDVTAPQAEAGKPPAQIAEPKPSEPAAKAEPPAPKAAAEPAKPEPQPTGVAAPLLKAAEGETIGPGGIGQLAASSIILSAPKSKTGPADWSLRQNAPELPSVVRFAGAEAAQFDSGSLQLSIAPGSLVELSEDEPAKWLKGEAAGLALAPGKLRLRNEPGRELTIVYPAEARFEIRNRPEMTDPAGRTESPAIEVHAVNAPLTVRVGRTEHSLPAGGLLRLEAEEKDPKIVEAPAGLAGEKAKSGDAGAALVTRLMRRYLATNRPLSTSIIDAETDELSEVRDQAMKIALWIDREDIVADILTGPGSAVLRESAVHAVREGVRRGEAAAGRAIDAVADELGLNGVDAELLKSLLTVPAAAEDLEGKKRLVNALEHDSKLIRQLALERLMRISGRDSMGFDPDAPTPKGLEAWKMWIGVASPDSRP